MAANPDKGAYLVLHGWSKSSAWYRDSSNPDADAEHSARADQSKHRLGRTDRPFDATSFDAELSQRASSPFGA